MTKKHYNNCKLYGMENPRGITAAEKAELYSEYTENAEYYEAKNLDLNLLQYYTVKIFVTASA